MKSNVSRKGFLVLILVSAFSFVTFTCKQEETPDPAFRDTTSIHPTGLIEDNYLDLQKIPLASGINTSIIPTLRNAVALPGAVSLNVPLPGKQGTYNNCVSWAVCYGLLGYLYKFIEGHSGYTGDDRNFSPSYIWNQLKDHKNQGGTIYSSLSEVVKQGCCKLTDMPANTTIEILPSNTAKANAAKFKITDFYRLNNDVDMIKYGFTT